MPARSLTAESHTHTGVFDGTAERFSRRTVVLLWVHVVLLALYVLAFRYLPLQDYPEWVYHGVVFDDILFGGSLSDYGLHPYVPPNAVSTIAIGALALIFPHELAGKLFLIAMMVLLYIGAIRFMRITVRGHDPLLAWAAFFFLFNYTFWLGNLSFYFGLGLALYGGHLLLKRGWSRSIAKTSLLVTAAYLCHFFSWFFILFIVTGAALLEREGSRLRRLALATVPSALLFVHYVLVRAPGEEIANPAYSLAEMLVRKLQMFAGAIIPFQRFKGVAEPEFWMAAVNYGVVAAIGLLVVIAIWRLLRERRLELNSLLALPLPLLVLALPFFAGGIIYPGQRLVLFFVINIVAYVAAAYNRLARRLTPFFAALGIATFIYAAWFTARFDAMAREGVGPVGESYLASSTRGGTDGFLRLPYYDAMIKLRPMPIFNTGIIRSSTFNVQRSK